MPDQNRITANRGLDRIAYVDMVHLRNFSHGIKEQKEEEKAGEISLKK